MITLPKTMLGQSHHIGRLHRRLLELHACTSPKAVTLGNVVRPLSWGLRLSRFDRCTRGLNVGNRGFAGPQVPRVGLGTSQSVATPLRLRPGRPVPAS